MDDSKMAELLAKSIHEGQRAVPQEHKPLVCKPRVMESWRIFRIMSEFVEGFDILRKYGLAATFFGSARLAPTDPEYKVAQDLAARLSEKGLAIITGGSAGVMRAANQGAFEKGGASVGLNIDLPSKQRDNPFLTESYNFYHFFVRKVMLTYASEVYVYFPGGYGTMDEFFEIITLVQTGKIRRVPIVLIERSYWEPLINFMKKSMLEERGAIDEEDLELYTIVDTVDEAFDYIVANVTC